MDANRKFSLSLKGVVLICLPLIFELLFVVTLTNLVREAEADAALARSSAQLIQRGHRLVELAFAAASGCQGYASTGNPLYRDLYKRASGDFPGALQEFAESATSNQEQAIAQRQIIVVSKRYLDILAHDISPAGLAQEEKSISAEALSMLQNRIVDFLGEEEDIRQKRFVAQVDARQHLNQVIFVAFGCNLLLAVALSLFFSAHITKRLRVMTANATRLSAGEPLNPPVQGTDEIAQLDKVFHDMATSLGELEKIKREFVAMVTHDLRVPLTAIQLFLQSMNGGLYGEIPPEMGARAVAAEKNANHLLKLIKDLLDIAQLESGTFNLKLEPVDLNDLIQDSIESIQPLAKERKITIARRGPERVEVVADAGRIKQVLTNLLSNAIKFSPEDASITVACSNKGNDFEISIVDSGNGIAPELQPLVFDRFKRSSVGNHSGTGLGLAICKCVIEKHGGKIGVKSEVGKGTTFWFQLPQRGIASGLILLACCVLNGCAASATHQETAQRNIQAAELSLRSAKACMSAQNYSGALKAATDAIRMDPRSHMAYLLHGYALFKLNKPSEAIADFDRAAALRPADYQSYEYRGSAFQQMQRFRKAVRDYRTAISTAPNDPNVLAKLNRELGLCNLAFGELDQAQLALSKAIELHPADPELYTARAIAELHLALPAKSVDDASQAIRLDARNASAYHVRSRAYGSLHQTKLSDADERRSRELYRPVTPQ